MIGFPQEMAPSEEVDCNLSCQNHISKAQKIYSGWIRGNGCWKSRAQGQKSIGRMQLMYANTWRVTDFLFPSPLPHSYDLVFSSVSLLSKFTNVVNITTLQIDLQMKLGFFQLFWSSFQLTNFPDFHDASELWSTQEPPAFPLPLNSSATFTASPGLQKELLKYRDSLLYRHRCMKV